METQESNTTQLNSQVEFINSLELADNETPAAFIAGGSIISFVSDINSQDRQDVLQSTLLAQLAADKAIGRTPPDLWLKKYVDVLMRLGWQSEQPRFTDFLPKTAQFLFDDVLSETSGGFFNEEQEGVLKKTVQTITSVGKEDERLKLFEASNRSLVGGNFQLGIARSFRGKLILDMLVFSFLSKADIPTVWGGTFSSPDTTFQVAKLRFVFIPEVYDMVREDVSKKLESHVNHTVRDLGI